MYEKGLREKPTRHHSCNDGYVGAVGVSGASTGKKGSRRKRSKTLFKSKSNDFLPNLFGGDIQDQNLEKNQQMIREQDKKQTVLLHCSSGAELTTMIGQTVELENINNNLENNINPVVVNEYENNGGNEDSPSSITRYSLEDQNNRYNVLVSNNDLDENDRQSLKRLSASAPAIRTDLGSHDKGELFMAPSSSKSRQKKFHRHFKTVPQEEKVLDYYSCALVGDILLQGFLYISENYFAFYSNVFGYVTKLLIPITTVVNITKERTAKIFPNAVGIQTQSEKHVFASLISRDSTFKLMCKVWVHTKPSDTLITPKDSHSGFDDTSGDIAIADDSTGESGNDSALEPSSCSPSPQSTPGIDKVLHHHVKFQSSHNNTNVIAHKITSAQLEDANLPPGTLKINGVSGQVYLRHPHGPYLDQNPSSSVRKVDSQRQSATNLMKGSRELLILATVLLVILFISAALLLFRISNLQQRLTERPTTGNSEQFYQDLLTWQTHLHSSSADEIHQFIDTNLQQIVKVRESLEALSTLFLNGQHNSIGDHAPMRNADR